MVSFEVSACFVFRATSWLFSYGILGEDEKMHRENVHKENRVWQPGLTLDEDIGTLLHCVSDRAASLLLLFL